MNKYNVFCDDDELSDQDETHFEVSLDDMSCNETTSSVSSEDLSTGSSVLSENESLLSVYETVTGAVPPEVLDEQMADPVRPLVALWFKMNLSSCKKQHKFKTFFSLRDV